MKTRSQLSNHNTGAVHAELLGRPGKYRETEGGVFVDVRRPVV